MATTANPPDGSFIAAGEPDEDIAAIAKQISDHAEVIYQTWKARGLAPNEILTCHNNLNATDKFGSVLTPKTLSPSSSPPANTPMTDLLYNNRAPPSVNSGSLEQIVNKFVVEDKARLAVRQSKADTMPGALSTAKNYPSSIQYALQKFEKKSPEAVAPTTSTTNCPNKYTCISPPPPPRTAEKVNNVCPSSSSSSSASSLSSSPSAKVASVKSRSRFVERNPPEPFIPVSNAPLMVKPTDVTDSASSGSSTWPLKSKSPVGDQSTNNMSPTRGANDANTEYRKKASTLPSKMATHKACEDFMDEVAKEEEKLINALKTGIVITANDPKLLDYRSEVNVQPCIQPPMLPQFERVEGKLRNTNAAQSPPKLNTKPSMLTETIESLCKRCDPSDAETGDVCDFAKRRRRAATPIMPCSAADATNSDSTNPQCRPNLRANAANNQSPNPVRPFLTRGSVAERVMMFEKCPTEILEKRTKGNNVSWKNLASDVSSKIQNYTKEANQRKSVYPPHTTLQRHTKANKNVFIPRFHYPNGKPISQQQQNIIFKNIEDTFQSLPNFQATKEQFASVTKACGCPLYWKAALFIACGGEKLGLVELDTFLEYWRDLTTVCHDEASRFMRILTRSAKRSYIIPEDLIPLVQDVVNTHPGLTFLKQAPEFHSRYVHTVICRVYYSVNQSWNGQITLAELRKADFLRAMQLLEEEEDINQVTAYFSYEHFYVIYCKFWELDRDHDLFISKEDLARHSDHALSSRIIDRIFSRTRSKSRNSLLQEGKMSYTDFVIFLLAEEDKRHPRAIEYWFRCMDIDGDGFLSMYELEHFYDEQLQRMEVMGIECLPFEDCLCQMLDMIQPRIAGKISLSDLKRCKMTPIFFDTFFNLEKYLDHEQRDPFASQRDHENEMSDWDRYAAEEYELLVAEESGNDQCEDIGQYRLSDAMDEDEDEEDDDIFSSNLDEILNGPREFVNNKVVRRQNNNYIVDGDAIQPCLLATECTDTAGYNHNGLSDSSDGDYAGDSDDCSL